MTGPVERVPLTDQQIIEWRAAVAYSYEAGEPPQDTSPEVLAVMDGDGGLLAAIAELRASRARQRELVTAFRSLSEDHAEWQRIARKAATQRDEHAAELAVLRPALREAKRRNGEVLAMCEAADTDLTPRLLHVMLLDPRVVRAALTGTETTSNPVVSALLAAAEGHLPRHRDYLEGYVPETEER